MILRIKGTGDIRSLDLYLSKHFPAYVTQHVENGQSHYVQDAEDRYAVQLLMPQLEGIVTAAIRNFGFDVVSRAAPPLEIPRALGS